MQDVELDEVGTKKAAKDNAEKQLSPVLFLDGPVEILLSFLLLVISHAHDTAKSILFAVFLFLFSVPLFLLSLSFLLVLGVSAFRFLMLTL